MTQGTLGSFEKFFELLNSNNLFLKSFELLNSNNSKNT